MARNTDSFQELFKTAKEQQGFFTARQAVASGYSEKNHAFHVNRGTWVREVRGIYRLAQFPEPEDADLILWSLWSRDRKGKTQGIYSHQTALRVHELTDLNPPKLHLTVPPVFRRSAPIPKVLVLHRGMVEPKDVERKKGYTVTNVRRTLEDLALEKSVTEEILRQGVEEGIRRGILKLREVSDSPVLRKMAPLARRAAGGGRQS
jgi:predicted transcriptional regulator of viral defense system